MFLCDLKCYLSNIESFKLQKKNGLKDFNFLTWTGVSCAVPGLLEFEAAKLTKIMLDDRNLKSETTFLIQHLASLGISTVRLYPVRRQSPEASKS